jgi:hypothetical protein
MNLDFTFHLPSLKTRLSESPVDKIVVLKDVTLVASAAQVTVPFQDDTSVAAVGLRKFTVGSTNPGEIDFNLTAIGATDTITVLAVGTAVDLA